MTSVRPCPRGGGRRSRRRRPAWGTDRAFRAAALRAQRGTAPRGVAAAERGRRLVAGGVGEPTAVPDGGRRRRITHEKYASGRFWTHLSSERRMLGCAGPPQAARATATGVVKQRSWSRWPARIRPSAMASMTTRARVMRIFVFLPCRPSPPRRRWRAAGDGSLHPNRWDTFSQVLPSLRVPR